MSEYTKQQVWQWLKAENRYKPLKEPARPVLNRAAVRKLAKQAKRGK